MSFAAFLLMKRTRLLNGFGMAAVLCTSSFLGVACRDGDRAKDTPAPAGEARGGAALDTNATLGPEISVSGCLTANLDGRSYALTPTDSATSPAERSMQMPGRTTVTYELVGDAEDFRRHANTVVTARGREDASVRREADVERKDETEQRPSPGASDVPTVETKEEVEVDVRRLHVVSVAASGAVCPSLGDQSRPSTEPPARPQPQP